MAWTQIVSYTLVLSSFVVCDSCGGLFGIWLQLGVPLGVFCLTEALLPPSHLPSPTCPLYVGTTPDITAMPVKTSQNQARQTIGDD